MNAIVKALYTKLAADATLSGLLASATSIYDTQAPEGAPLPYVVIKKSSGDAHYALGGTRTHRRQLYTIKAITQSDAAAIDASKASAIDERIDAVIGLDGNLSITGAAQILCRRRQDMPDYEETTTDSVFIHRGGIYEIWSA